MQLKTMLTIEQIVGITLASVVLIVVPGPSVMFVVGRALSYGRAVAIASIIGNTIGCYSVGVVIALGLGPLLERSEALFQVIKWAGVLYLIYLGVQAIRHAAPAEAEKSEGEDEDRGAGDGAAAKARAKRTRGGATPPTAVRDGFIIGLTNPKVFVIFTAIVPQFINPAAGGATVQMLLLGLVPMLIGLVTDACWALVASRARTWLAGSPKRMTAIGRIGGISIIGVGVSVALFGDHR